MKQNETILLIGNELGRFESLALMFRQIGYKVLSAADGREGFRLTRRESPDLVICEINLPIISALEFCRMIRADRELWATPLMFVSESDLDSKNLAEILDAGADECLVEFINPQYLAAKAAWLIKRKYSENYLIQNYEIQRSRQLHITQIIKSTSSLLTMSKLEQEAASLNEFNNLELQKQISERIDWGMNMIGALANLLEEQVSALETWRHTRRGDEFVFDRKLEIEIAELDGEYVTYTLEENDLSAR